MTFTKRLLSAMTAAAILATTVPAVLAVPASAEITKYELGEYVPFSFLTYSGASDEVEDKLISIFEKATNKDYGNITFADLERITSLNLSGLKLEGLPKALQYMTRLRTLNLSNNMLCSADLNSVDLSYDIALSSLDLSNNYITTVPSWYVSMDITTKKINNNLMNTADQRSLVASPAIYYFMDGEVMHQNELKNKILASIRMSDGSALPKFFFDPDDLPYDPDDDSNTGVIGDNPPMLEIDKWDLSKFLKKNSDGEYVVTAAKAANTDVTVRLYYGSNSSTNKNTNVTVKLYFLNGNDPTSINVRLETLIAECAKYDKTAYTESSWLNFDSALKTAQTIFNYGSADAEMIKDALDNLEHAKAALVKGVDADTKKVIKDLLAIAKERKEEDYTPKSWAAFAAAVEKLNECITDTETSVTVANSAIKAYQDAQAGLTSTSLSVPATAPKSDFDGVYGEDKKLTYKGVTRGGYAYSWVFNGKDITEPKDLNPEIKYESENEEAIRYEVGSASDFQLISFAEKGKFPGKAAITLDVSGKYKNGTYRLYKWDSTAKKGEFVDSVTIKDGSVTIEVSEGGDYFISSVLQNFDLISNIFKIDNNKLTVSISFKSRYTVASFKNSIENGSAVIVKNADGTEALDTDYIATGMTAAAANSDATYTIIVPGDVTGDGAVTAMDAVEILRAVIGEITLDTYAQKAAGDVTGDGWVRADDAVQILKYSIGME